MFVGYSHRAALALERRSGGDGGQISGVSEATELSNFCHRVLCSREGQRWPACYDDNESGANSPEELQSSWVDWLQYFAGLQEKLGEGEEAQQLLQLAYEYVRRCSKRREGKGRDHSSVLCAAYAGILKVHAAATITSQQHLPRSTRSKGGIAIETPTRKQATKNRAGGQASDGPNPASFVHNHCSRGLDYIDKVIDAIRSLVSKTDGRSKAVGVNTEASASIGAAVKAWKWAQKSCGVIALWVEEVGGGVVSDSSLLGKTEWAGLNNRGLRVLADLSRALAAVRRRAQPELLDKIPPGQALAELAFDSYLRTALAHLAVLSNAISANKETASGLELLSEEDARESFLSAEQMCESEVEFLSARHIRRVGTGWFGLGQALVDGGKTAAGLDALVRGCCLLESWVDSEKVEARVNTDTVDAKHSEILQSVQLDLRLSKVSKVLVESGELVVAAAAMARALAFCPELWRVHHDGELKMPANAQALVERYVACTLRSNRPPDAGRENHSGSQDGSKRATETAGEVKAVIGKTLSYLTDGDDLPADSGRKKYGTQHLASHLRRRRVPAETIALALVAECHAYRNQLLLYIPDGADHSTCEGSPTLSACIAGHRRATNAVLMMCESSASDGRSTTSLNRPESWEARASLASAWFEHDLFLVAARVGRQDPGETGTAAARILADLPRGIQHAVRGSVAASSIEDGRPASAAAVAGVCACVQAMLLRDLAESGSDVEDAMRKGLDLLSEATKTSAGIREVTCTAGFEPCDAQSILSCLEVMKAHYSLHRNTPLLVRSAELQVALADSWNTRDNDAGPAMNTAMAAGALSSIGSAFHAAGVPTLPPIFSIAASDKLRELEAAGEAEELQASANCGNSEIFDWTHHEEVRVSVDMLRALCLADRTNGVRDAEKLLLEARRAVSAGECVGKPAVEAYLECMAGLGLSWVYERCGRLAESMVELRQVLRLCHSWASSGDPLSVPDRQFVALSATKGASIHDEEPGKHPAVAGPIWPEEGVDEESGEVEETIEANGVQDGKRDDERVALISRWLPPYLEALMRMGRLWRAKGFASKASGYLRQGCVVSEPLRAPPLLRSCLVEEVKVAAQMHRFRRAERLLEACQSLLEQERRDDTLSEKDATVSGCMVCDPLDKSTAPPMTVAGKNSKRGTKKGVGRAKARSTPKIAAPTKRMCIRCREFSLNATELLVTESDILRRQGDFGRALSACERGQSTLGPVVQSDGQRVHFDSCLNIQRLYSAIDPGEGENEEYALGWRTAEILAALCLQQGRAAYLVGDTATAKDLLRKCAESQGGRVLVRAAALYRLGRMSLDEGDAAEATKALQDAESLSRGTGAPKLVRRVRRALTVALMQYGGGESEVHRVRVDRSWRIAALSSLSIGIMHCNQATHMSARRARNGESSAESFGESAGLRLFDVVSRGGGNSPGGPQDGCLRRKGECVSTPSSPMGISRKEPGCSRTGFPVFVLRIASAMR